MTFLHRPFNLPGNQGGHGGLATNSEMKSHPNNFQAWTHGNYKTSPFFPSFQLKFLSQCRKVVDRRKWDWLVCESSVIPRRISDCALMLYFNQEFISRINQQQNPFTGVSLLSFCHFLIVKLELFQCKKYLRIRSPSNFQFFNMETSPIQKFFNLIRSNLRCLHI